MDHTLIERDSVVERYVAGQLTGEEEVRFEEHLIGCSRCLEQVEMAEDFQHSFRVAVAEEVTRTAVGAGLLGWLRRRGTLAALAMVLVAGCAFLLWRLQALSGDLEELRLAQAETPADSEAATDPAAASRAPRINAAIVTLAVARTSGNEDPPINQLSLPEEPGWLVLAMELALVEHDSYQVILLAPDGETLWEDDGLRPDAYGTLSASLHSSTLAPGDYRFEITATSNGRQSQIGRYRFRVL